MNRIELWISFGLVYFWLLGVVWSLMKVAKRVSEIEKQITEAKMLQVIKGARG